MILIFIVLATFVAVLVIGALTAYGLLEARMMRGPLIGIAGPLLAVSIIVTACIGLTILDNAIVDQRERAEAECVKIYSATSKLHPNASSYDSDTNSLCHYYPYAR